MNRYEDNRPRCPECFVAQPDHALSCKYGAMKGERRNAIYNPEAFDPALAMKIERFPYGLWYRFAPGEEFEMQLRPNIKILRVERVLIEPRQARHFTLLLATHGPRIIAEGPLPLAMLESVHHTSSRAPLRMSFDRPILTTERVAFRVRNESKYARTCNIALDCMIEAP